MAAGEMDVERRFDRPRVFSTVADIGGVTLLRRDANCSRVAGAGDQPGAYV